MSTCTAIILRDQEADPVHVLECDGPKHLPFVRTSPRSIIKPFLSLDEFCAHLAHERMTERHPSLIDHLSACRIMRILTNSEKTGALSARAMREIKARFVLLHPGCENSACF